MFVKICGITRREDAEAAVRAGADALGFVFWPDSPRFIDPFRARAIASGLPPFVTPVGVFVDQPVEYVNGVGSLVHLGAVQLHGDESRDYLRTMTRPVVKAVSLRAGTRAVIETVAFARRGAARCPRPGVARWDRANDRLGGCRRGHRRRAREEALCWPAA